MSAMLDLINTASVTDAPARPTPPAYVTVFPADGRSGWLCAARHGSTITHHRISAAKHDREAARAEAQMLFPDRLVYVQGDPDKPWA